MPSAIRGVLPAPASKSMTVRAVAAALLAQGVSRIANVSYCDDGLAALGIVTDLGAVVLREREGVTVTSSGIREGTGRDKVVNCGESGLSMRMFAPISAILPWKITLEASGSLKARPMEMVASLEQLGVSMRTDQGHAPVTVKGPMEGGLIEIDAGVSSQFLTGLLMALPVCPKSSTILVSGLKSAPYVHMTIGLIRHFGINLEHDDNLTRFVIEGGQSYKPSSYTVEGDWSGAAFILVAGAIAGESTVTGLDIHSLQADRAVLGALDLAGARLNLERDGVTVVRQDLKAFTFDAADCPDLFPPLVALAANCRGTSVIHGAGRLTHKESDRAQALLQEFGKLGIAVEISGDRMEVRGGMVQAATVDAHNDHRIAMACAVAALRGRGQVRIEGSECVAKSYPAFFSDLERLKSEHE